MSKNKVYENSALNLQLKITAEINELLKTRGINVTALRVDLKTTKKKSKKIMGESKDVIYLDGEINITVHSRLNEKNIYDFKQEENEEENDEILEEDFIQK